MPTAADRAVLVDTSIAVALVVVDHEHHEATTRAVGKRTLGLAGHAAFETYSVLSRLPGPLRRPPAVILEVLERDFPATRHLGADVAGRLLAQLAAIPLAGGSVYDALVGATALAHGMTLLTRDRRAVDTYRAVGVPYQLL
jgi:predicted nucleic acid-binding protein